MNYRIAIILLPILALLSCAKDNITISPNVVNVNCDEHTIIFHTNQSFTYISLWWPYDTDSQNITDDVDEDWNQVITGDWFVIKGKLHSSNEVELHIQANEGQTRRLKFSIDREPWGDEVIVTQFCPDWTGD